MDFTLPEFQLFRPFDDQDEFFHSPQRMEKLNRYRGIFVSKHSDVDRQVFDLAFNKCARLTIALSNVPNVEFVSNTTVREQLVAAVRDQRGDCFIGVNLTNPFDEGAMFSPCVATLFVKSGPECAAYFATLRAVLDAGLIRVVGGQGIPPIKIHEIGRPPVESSLRNTFHEVVKLLAARRPPNPPSPTPAVVNPPGLVQGPLWLPPFATHEPHLPVLPADHSYFQQRSGALEQTIASLAQLLDTLRAEPSNVQKAEKYLSVEGVEWLHRFQLGSGAEAKVFLGFYKPSPDLPAQPVAIKQSLCNPIMLNAREAEICMQYSGNSIVKYHHHYEHYPLSILVQELGLFNLERLMKECPLNRMEKYRITIALLQAVGELHRKSPVVVHRDIRSPNILIMRNGGLRLADLGLAVVMRRDFTSTLVTSKLTSSQPYEVQQAYVAAEGQGSFEQALTGLPASAAGDVFMLGCVLFQLYTGAPPFASDKEILDQKRVDFSPELTEANPWLVHLLRLMLSHDRAQRPTIDEILKHPFVLGEPDLEGCMNKCIMQNLYKVIVNGKKPHDTPEFRNLEQLLAPIETDMARAVETGNAWVTKVPGNLRGLNCPNAFEQLYSPISHFQGAVVTRPYPLPLVAQLVQWMRNAIAHFGELQELTEKFRASRPSGQYEAPGQFFAQHPAVAWFLPSFWERYVQHLAELRNERREMKERHEHEISELQQKELNASCLMH